MKIMKLLILVTLFEMAGCMGTSVLMDATPPDQNNARVYFIRDNMPPHLERLELVVNSQTVAEIADDDFAAVNIPVGTNNISIENSTDPTYPSVKFDLHVARGEDMYILVTGDIKQEFDTPTLWQHTITRHWAFYQLSKEKAQTITKKMKHQLLGKVLWEKS